MKGQPENAEWWRWPLMLFIGYWALMLWLWVNGTIVFVAWNWVIAPIFGAERMEFWPATVIGVILFGLAKVGLRGNRS